MDGQASAPVAGEYVSMQPIPQPGNAPLDLALQYAAYQGGHVLQEHAQGPSYEGLDQINPSVLMQQPPPAPPPKMIKKLEVTVFCSQHNPVSTATQSCLRRSNSNLLFAGRQRRKESTAARKDQSRLTCSSSYGAHQTPRERRCVRSDTRECGRRHRLRRGSLGSWDQEGVQVGQCGVR